VEMVDQIERDARSGKIEEWSARSNTDGQNLTDGRRLGLLRKGELERLNYM